MTTQLDQAISEAIAELKNGNLIAYPTEAVYGFGADPDNSEAVTKLLQLKHRSYKKGLIIIAANYDQLLDYIEPLAPHLLTKIIATWPGPVTWLFPASRHVAEWLRGTSTKIAVRVTAHPIGKMLCEKFGKPIISTSANIQGNPPLRDYRSVMIKFGDSLGAVISDRCGPQTRPTEIRDAVTGEIIRPG